MFYSWISVWVLQIGKISSGTENILLSAKTLVARAYKQGANDEKIWKNMGIKCVMKNEWDDW